MALRWDPEVSAAANQALAHYGIAVDKALIHAVIEKETLHGALPITGTREPNGHYSYGPMQVMDSTAAQHGINDPTTLAIPSIGIRIGTFELARLLKLFPGDTPRAIAAYNAGAGNAARNSAGLFFNQSYVNAVLGFWNQFRTALGPAASASAPVVLVLAAAAAWFILSRPRRLAWR